MPDSAATLGAPVGEPAADSNDLLSQRVQPVQPNAGSLPAGMVRYVRYTGPESGKSDRLLAMHDSDLVAFLARIVEAEGPIHVEELLRTATRMYHARLTGQVKSKLETAFGAGKAARRLDVGGKFAWPPGLTIPPVRWRGGDDDPKEAEHICHEEVAQAAVLFVQREYGIPLDDLPAATLRSMGFKRIGPQLVELGNTAIQQAIAAQRIRPDASGYMVAAEVPSG